MNRQPCVAFIFAGIILAACGAPPGADDPANTLGEEMIFDDEELSDNNEEEGEEMEFQEDETADDLASDEEEDLEFDDDEGMQIYLESIPPAGQWSLTHLAGEMICPDIPILAIPTEPPAIIILVMSEDGKTMSFPSEDGTITLTQILVSSEGDYRYSFYEGSLFVAGEDLKYDMEYNIVGNGRLTGSIEFTFEECLAERGISAEYIGP